MEPEITKLELENGLLVLLKEIHTAPIISHWMWYRVGSKDELPGMTGASHWVEHMQFKGTAQHPTGSLDKAISRDGGTWNAFTHLDWTAYYETLPADKIVLGMRLEADRMVNSLFDPQEFESERTVIISERQGNENEPLFRLSEEIQAAAFRVHNYHHEVIGDMVDLQSMQREQLYDHYRRFYIPNNAVLVVAGDFETEQMLANVHQHYGSIPSGAAPILPLRPEPEQTGERCVSVEGPGETTYLELAYRAPTASQEDFFALIVLDSLLSGPSSINLFGAGISNKTSRLYQATVDKELAVGIAGGLQATKDPYLYAITAILHPDRKMEELTAAIDQEISRLQETPPEPYELLRAVKQAKALFAYGNERITNQAFWLGITEMLDNHAWFENYFNKIIHDYPAGHSKSSPGLLKAAKKSERRLSTDRKWRIQAMKPRSTPNPLHSLPGPEDIVRQVLPNGITILSRANFNSPSVVISGYSPAGGVFDPGDKLGLADFVASTLMRGVQELDFFQIYDLLKSVGASLGFGGGVNTIGLGAKALVEDLDMVLHLLAQALRYPVFPPEEIEKVRTQLLTSLSIRAEDTGMMASLLFDQIIYPGHPYSRPEDGYPETIMAIQPQDLVEFHRQHYGPQGLTIAIVGAIDPQEAIDKVAKILGDWRNPNQAAVVELPDLNPLEKNITRQVSIPGKSQADVLIGAAGPARLSSDFISAMVGNHILGQFGMMGRIGEVVREKAGLAYYAASNMSGGSGPGPWNISAGVDPENIEKTMDLILQEIKRFTSELVSAEELADSQANFIGRLPLSFEANTGVAGALTNLERYQLGLDYYQRYPQLIRDVTPESILQAAQAYLDCDRLGTAIAGP